MIERLVKEFGNDQDCQQMKDYVSKFDKFCRRSVFEVPPNIFHYCDPQPGERVLIVKLNLPKGHTALQNVVAAKRKLAEILKVEVFALQLCSITKGCVCLQFLVSHHLESKVSQVSESTLIDMKIKWIQIKKLVSR